MYDKPQESSGNLAPKDTEQMIGELPQTLAGTQPEAQSAARRKCVLSMAEQSLLARARSGEQRAMREFYEAYLPQVRGHIYRLVGSDNDADDLIQTVFSQAFSALDGFKGESAISTWLYRITANTTHNVLRKRFRIDRIKRAFHTFTVSRGSEVGSQKVEARDEAHRILEQISPQLREVFVLYHYEGLTLAEISKILNSPISTVGDRLTRARKKLREVVED